MNLEKARCAPFILNFSAIDILLLKHFFCSPIPIIHLKYFWLKFFNRKFVQTCNL